MADVKFTTEQDVRDYLRRRYFSDWEVVRALESCEPVRYLVSVATAGSQGSWCGRGAGTLHYQTRAPKLDILNWGTKGKPFTIKLADLARETLADAWRTDAQRLIEVMLAYAEQYETSYRQREARGGYKGYEYLGTPYEKNMADEARRHVETLRHAPIEPRQLALFAEVA